MSYSLLHHDHDKATKTFIGGVASMLISAYLLYSGVNGLVRMFGLESPYILSLENKLSLATEGRVDFLS